jgi:hypothetical protein
MVHSLDVIVVVQFNIGLLLPFFFWNFIEVGCYMFLLLMVVDLGLPFFFNDISSSSLINEAQHKNTFLNYEIAHT